MDLIASSMNKNLPFTTRTKMADVIHLDYHLIPIIGRFGIEYGFGNKTVVEVCEQQGINVWFFLEIINSYHNPLYFPKKQLRNFSAILIINYLTNTHNYYLEAKVPEIQEYIDDMEHKASKENQKNIVLLNDFFKKYKEELINHLKKEDNIVFPYILKLEEAMQSKELATIMTEKIINESIENYERGHDNLEVKLSDLKNLIVKFMPPVLCKETCQRLLTELFRLETDLENHARIEEKVLIPKVKLIEQKVLETGGKNR